jgi:hypothetical protein
MLSDKRFVNKKLTKIKALSDSVAVVFSLRSLGDYHSQVLGGANSLKQELQHFRLNTDPDPGYDQKLTKIYS